jgi:hypothetical protein
MPSMHQSVVTGDVAVGGEVEAGGEGEAEGDSGTGTGETRDGVGLGGSPRQAVRRRVSQTARTRQGCHVARSPFSSFPVSVALMNARWLPRGLVTTLGLGVAKKPSRDSAALLFHHAFHTVGTSATNTRSLSDCRPR